MTPIPRSYTVVILLIAALLRLGVILTWETQLLEDRDAYLGIAQGIWQGRGFCGPGSDQPTAFRPPLYPVVIAPIATPECVHFLAAVQLVWGVATVWLTMLLARNLRLGVAGCLVSGLIAAVDPIALRYTTYAMTETLAMLLSAWWLVLAVRAGDDGNGRTWAAAGAVLGFACLCRPTYLVTAALWFMGLLVAHLPKTSPRVVSPSQNPASGISARSGLSGWLLSMLALIGVISIWGGRNCLVFDRPVLTTTHGGYTLLLANNPVYYHEVVAQQGRAPWNGDSLNRWQNTMHQELHSAGVSGEIAQDKWMRRKATDYIWSHPREFLQAAVQRFFNFWSPAPERTASSPPQALVSVVTTYYGTLWVVAIIGLGVWWSRPNRLELLPALALVLSFVLVHLVYWTDARMRAPLLPAIAVIAGAVVSAADARRDSFRLRDRK